MESWVLVILVYAGPLAPGDSVALQTVPGFDNQARCEAAGRQLKPLTQGTYKEVRFACIKK